MKNIGRLLQVLDKWKHYYLAAAVLLIASGVVRMLQPKVLQVVVDAVVVQDAAKGANRDAVAQLIYTLLPNPDESISWALIGAAIIFVIIALVQAGTQFAASTLSASSTEKAIKKLRDRLFAHIQALPLGAIDQVARGELIQRCTGDVDTVRNFIGTQIIELIRLVAIFVGAFSMMYIVHVGYAFIAISMFLPIVLTAFFFFQREQKVWKAHEKEQDELTAIIQENLAGIRVVKAFAQENRELDRFHQQNLAKRKIGVRHINLHTFFWPLSDIMVLAQVVLTVAVGAWFALQQTITIGEFASFFTYGVMVTWPMRSIGRIVSQLGMASVAMQRMREILDLLEEDYGSEQIEQSPLRGEIEFRKVSFSYPSKDGQQKRQALKNVSFKVQAGERIALMGGTAAGKSTLIALLARFYEPDEGEILLDGRPLASYHKAWLRRQLGIVHQKAFLFSTTIRNNVNYVQGSTAMPGHLHPMEESNDFEQVLQDARMMDFIPKMKKGLDTLVGEKGVTLSGGQKQRVALARTLLSNPAILVLDDATSAVDTETEFAIQQALKRRMQGKTTFIIAHRLTSVQQADRIFIFDKGQLIQKGTHEALLKEKGFYKQVYDIQISLEEKV